MRAHGVLIVAFVLSLAALPTALAHDGPTIGVVAPPSDQCPSGKDLCLEFNADPPAISPGDQVDLAFFNDDERSHTIMITAASDADSSHQDTPKSVALASTPSVAAGESSSENLFTVPEGASTLYVWCDVSGHEASGMWIEVPVQGGSDADGSNGSPLGLWVALAGLAGAALVLGRRRD